MTIPRYSKWLTLALCLITVATILYVFALRNQLNFWSSHDDYSYLSLSHALSFEQRIKGEGYTTNGGLAGHPGVPFHLASWLAWKLAFPSGAETFASILAGDGSSADRFGAAASIVALCLTFVGVGLVFVAARGHSPLVPLVATLAYFAFTSEAWTAAARLGIESFSLATAALFYIAARRAFGEEPKLLNILALGVVGGLAYTLKLHYITYFVAGGVGLLFFTFSGGFPSWRQAIISFLSYIVGFLLGFLPLMLIVAGSYALERLMKFHLSVVLHSGYYGQGEATIIAPKSLLRSLALLVNTPATIAVSIIAVAIIISAAISVGRRKQQAGWSALLVTLIAAFLLSSLSVLKHFQAHYLPVPAAVTALLILYAQQDSLLSRTWTRVLVGSVLLGISVLVTVPAFIREQHILRVRAADVADDIRTIEQMTPGQDVLRVWDYRVPAQGFAAGFVVSYAGSPEIATWYEKADLRDRSFDINSKRPWRFAIIEHHGYRTEQDVRARWPGIRDTDRVRLLKATIVIERPAPSPQ